ncbi:hypothetical protein MKZ38_009965 [Zalerion maritima]|uniref:Uncharacterized protein n=1 Tax=Zalerion maritima TaxID=339359 RepID=A0AAD5WUR9_9PEZI|nr:hypothetical protein MKZ38_009965 [Zalerion maritima]
MRSSFPGDSLHGAYLTLQGTGGLWLASCALEHLPWEQHLDVTPGLSYPTAATSRSLILALSKERPLSAALNEPEEAGKAIGAAGTNGLEAPCVLAFDIVASEPIDLVAESLAIYWPEKSRLIRHSGTADVALESVLVEKVLSGLPFLALNVPQISDNILLGRTALIVKGIQVDESFELLPPHGRGAVPEIHDAAEHLEDGRLFFDGASLALI